MTKYKNIPWLKYKNFYFAFSTALLLISIYSLANWGLKFGIEFSGGTSVTYKTEQILTQESVSEVFSDLEIELASIQGLGEDQYILKFPQVLDSSVEITNALKSIDENIEEMQFQLVGPSVGPELVRKTFYAIIISAGSILLWVAFQFKSIKFGASSILAMLHDTFILIGLFSLLGHFYGSEVDFLFVTAVLTTLSFSVHDTIVVFDRIRELNKKQGDIEKIADQALTETMRRSIINSLTIIFMLLALVVLGGASIKWFATALLIGAVLGTYSSPFIAVPVLVLFGKIKKK